MALDAQKQAETEAEALFAKGIIPKSELENASKQRISAEMDMQAADEELKAVLERGSRQAVELARGDMEGARRRMADLEAQLKAAVVLSPVSGTVLAPETGRAEKTDKVVEKGVSFGEAEVLLAVGDMQGVSASVEVDELEVLKMREGQPASISGDAFPGLVLNGKVTSVSARAGTRRDAGGRAGKPGFEVLVAVDSLSAEEREKVRLGMSARIDITVSDRKDVLVVPFTAVELRGADRFVNVVDKAGQGVRSVKVETGATSAEGVEVVKGLAPGQEVAF
jgi:multidrug resistance efflux pump